MITSRIFPVSHCLRNCTNTAPTRFFSHFRISSPRLAILISPRTTATRFTRFTQITTPYAAFLNSRGLVSTTNTAINNQEKLESNIPSLVISERAAKQLRYINERDKNPNQLLRVIVESGGCHGYQNKMELTETVEDDDIVIESNGARIVTDSISLNFLRGSKIDFIEELIGTTFQVVDNPNAKNSCGCNISYDVDLEKLGI